MTTVLITTSGLGQRLGQITQFTNKSMVKVGKKPAISYIIESYPIDTRFIITLGHFGSHIKQFLSLAYPDRTFEFVAVDKYEGPGTSLAYSILQAQELINEPFIFHACDTIIQPKIDLKPDSNWVGGYKTNSSASYVSFDISGDKVLRLKDKGEINYDYSYIGIAGIKNYKEFFQYLKDAYQENPNNSALSDVIGVKQLPDLTYKVFDTWYDIGNTDGLLKARAEIADKFEILDKLEESIFIFNEFVIKFFSDEKICQNRVQRAKHLDRLVPKIIDSTKNFYKYEYSEGELLASVVNSKIINHFLNWASHDLWIRKGPKSSEFFRKCQEFYFDKTLSRINKLTKETGIQDVECCINGIKVPPICQMLESIDKNWLCNSPAYQFHGDFILDNIIKHKADYTLLDWRQDFAGELEHGDRYYDLAKLNHNLIFNHDLVNKGHFSCVEKQGSVECDILVSHNLIQCQQELMSFVNDRLLDWKKVSLLTAIIWINMAPLHHYPLNHFLFYFGKLNMYRVLNA